jgi:pyruvate dehydrogenase E1 component
LRHFFEVDRYHIAHAALNALHEMQVIDAKTLGAAAERWGIDADKSDPMVS